MAGYLPLETRIRVIEAAFTPAVTLARTLGLSFEDFEQLARNAYFRELRDRGLSLRAIAKRSGMSLRTIASLSKEVSEDAEPLVESETVGTRRKILRLLSERGEQGEDALLKATAKSRAFAREQLAELLESGFVVETDSGYALSAREYSFVGEDFAFRFDGLRHYFESISQMLYQRFFSASRGVSLGRVLSFNALPESLRAFSEEAYTTLRAAVVRLDGEAEGRAERQQASLAFGLTVAPDDPAFRPPRA